MLRLVENPVHLIVLLAVVLVVFGAGKLATVGGALGKSVKDFKRVAAEGDEPSAAASTSITECQRCHAPLVAGAGYCTRCGAAVRSRA